MPDRLNDETRNFSTGFIVPDALRIAVWREVTRVRSSRMFAGLCEKLLGRYTRPEPMRPRFASRASYYKHCKAALTQALAPYWQGSRAALKARMREILHPRRRDMSLLSGLLRATVAPAALAIFMLAASAESAHANTIALGAIAQVSGPAGPFFGVDAPFDATPGFAVLDEDGDWDAVSVEEKSNLNYFKSTSTPCSAVVKKHPSANPFYDLKVEIFSNPSFADLDGDGDQDVVVGGSGSLSYYRNKGSALQPVFVKETGENNPFNETYGQLHGYYRAPAFADFDGDGDLDAVVRARSYYGTIAFLRYYENTGTAVTPIFTLQLGESIPFATVDVRHYSTPALVDLDGDGDVDVLFGEHTGKITYYENTGTPLAPFS